MNQQVKFKIRSDRSFFNFSTTGGLDSFTAENVIESLHVLAGAGRTIICTIHQPNSIIYQKFDRLILLAKGRLVYNGT